MLPPVVLSLALSAVTSPADIIKAETFLRNAERARFATAVTLCENAGYGAEFKRLATEQGQLERVFREKTGRSAITDIVVDDRGDCETPDGFRRWIGRYQQALDDARDAMGMEE
jgi:hypothetical protein